MSLSHIAGALRSVYEQGHEVIIVDGGSRDNTLAIAYEITDTVIISKKGRALQMNSGASIASGEVLLFLHADTLLPDGVTRIFQMLVRTKIFGGDSMCDCQIIDLYFA